MPHHIVVVGAGVIGLQTALSLLEAGYKVTIVAKHWPGDFDITYASPWAGAHWRSHATDSEPHLQEFDSVTFKYWSDLLTTTAAAEGSTKSDIGIAFSPAIYLSPPDTAEIPWWSTLVKDYTVLPPSTLTSNLYQATYTTITINPPAYLGYLLSRLGDLGVSTITAELYDGLDEVWELPGLEDSDHEVDLVVNCTGLSAKELVNNVDDERRKLFPTKGQTVLVRGEARAVRYLQADSNGEGEAYVIPRVGSGTTILGGSRGVGDWDPTVDPSLSAQILARCTPLAPELLDPHTGEFEVISHQVGRRPTRLGGPRIELETLGNGRVVCHAYGHGGAGYQASVGSARRVVGLVEEYFARLQ
ncbi:hypothetical protein DFH27DRAFT_564105 [Peziza echinospora]|nr:hypothetical protein DFH27DRAFT_564105 [Peziza echinospora]